MPIPTQTVAIEAENLVKIYQGGKASGARKASAGGKPALDGISFTVAPGETFGLLGPNGSGKTTTVRILVTLLAKTSGTATVGGFDTERQQRQVRQLIGYAGQFTGIDDDLTVSENLAIAAMLYGVPHNESWRRAADLAERFALADVAGHRASRLSGGLRRRLDLARALIHRPAVLFLDEPTTGLDPQSRNALWEYLRQLSKDGMSVLLTTQYLEEADRACDRVAIIDAGKLVVLGTPKALKDEAGGGRLLLSIREAHARERAAVVLANWPGVVRVETGGRDDPVIVYCRDPAASLIPVLQLLASAGIEVTGAEQALVTLDDVFLHYAGRNPRSEAPAKGAVSGIFAIAHGQRRGGA
jgi:ABC-type multidrug transport system ATPase subunit